MTATVAACVLAVLTVTASPVGAEDLTVPDARGDYWHDGRSEGVPPTTGVQPDFGDPDVLRAKKQGEVEWSGPPRPCPVGWRVDFEDKVVIIDVPRSCLSEPRRVSFKTVTNFWPTSDDNRWRDVVGTTGYRLTEASWSPALRPDGAAEQEE